MSDLPNELTETRKQAVVLSRQRLAAQPIFLDTETTGVRSSCRTRVLGAVQGHLIGQAQIPRP